MECVVYMQYVASEAIVLKSSSKDPRLADSVRQVLREKGDRVTGLDRHFSGFAATAPESYFKMTTIISRPIG